QDDGDSIAERDTACGEREIARPPRQQDEAEDEDDAVELARDMHEAEREQTEHPAPGEQRVVGVRGERPVAGVEQALMEAAAVDLHLGMIDMEGGAIGKDGVA